MINFQKAEKAFPNLPCVRFAHPVWRLAMFGVWGKPNCFTLVTSVGMNGMGRDGHLAHWPCCFFLPAKKMFDVFGHPLNGLWKSLDFFFPHPSPLGLLLRLMASPQIEVKQKPSNHRAATSLYFFHWVLSHAFNCLSSLNHWREGLFQVNAEERQCLWRDNRCPSKVPSIQCITAQNAMICLGGSPTFQRQGERDSFKT